MEMIFDPVHPVKLLFRSVCAVAKSGKGPCDPPISPLSGEGRFLGYLRDRRQGSETGIAP